MVWRAVAIFAMLAVAALYPLGGVLLLGSAKTQEEPQPAPQVKRGQQLAHDVSRLPDPAAAPQDGPIGARLLRRTILRASPGGRPVRALSTRTGYGSRRVLAVVQQRGAWLGVLSQYMPNSTPGWIPRAAAELLFEPYELFVDISKRQIVVHRKGRRIRRIRVAVGRPGLDTPRGDFGVTDSLLIASSGGPYGCCALALTGRQKNVPQGWTGGDRIAIHGTANEATLGSAASNGCLRASDVDMRWLLKRIPLGARVQIRS